MPWDSTIKTEKSGIMMVLTLFVQPPEVKIKLAHTLSNQPQMLTTVPTLV